MTGGEAPRRYARALVDIAESRGTLDETGEALAEIGINFRETRSCGAFCSTRVSREASG